MGGSIDFFGSRSVMDNFDHDCVGLTSIAKTLKKSPQKFGLFEKI
jgi:hypothetical protein